MRILKITFILLASFLFMACPQSDDDQVLEPEMKIRIENTGNDMIDVIKVETTDQTITLNQVEVGSLSSYYIISNDNANSSINVTIQNTSGTSIINQVMLEDIDEYRIDISATSDLSNYSVSVNLD